MRTVWFLWLFSCSAGEEGPVFSDLRATFDDHLPTVLHIEATVDPASSVVLRYGSSKDAMVQALQRESGSTHTWTLTGLPQGSDLAFTVETTDESGQAVRGPIGEISVPKLGVPSLQLEVYDPKQSTLTDQWILVSLVRETGSALVAYTADGQAVWGYKAPADRTLAWPTVDGSDVLVLDVHRDRNIDDTYLRRIQ